MHPFENAKRPKAKKLSVLEHLTCKRQHGKKQVPPGKLPLYQVARAVVHIAVQILVILKLICINCVRSGFKVFMDLLFRAEPLQRDVAIMMGIAPAAHWASIAQEVSQFLHPQLSVTWKKFDASHSLQNLPFNEFSKLLSTHCPELIRKRSWGLEKIELLKLFCLGGSASIAYRLQSSASIYLGQFMAWWTPNAHVECERFRVAGIRGAVSSHCAAARSSSALMGLCFNCQEAIRIIGTIRFVEKDLIEKLAQQVTSSTKRKLEEESSPTSEKRIWRSKSVGSDSPIKRKLQTPNNVARFIISAGNSPRQPTSDSEKDLLSPLPSPRRGSYSPSSPRFGEITFGELSAAPAQGETLPSIKARHFECMTVHE